MNISLSDTSPKILNICVLGQSNTGKTALINRFINGKFPTVHDTTIEDQFNLPTIIDGIDCQLNITDTAGNADYQSMLDTWISNSEGFILVYSVEDKESFIYVCMIYERIVKIKISKRFSVIIVGNKCELEDKRKVTKEEVEKYCRGLNLQCMEISANKDTNVKETFLTLAKGLLKMKYPQYFKDEEETEKKKCYCF